VTEQFRVGGPAGSAGWTIKYFNAATGGTEITASVTKGGWLTPPLARGATREVRVEVTPGSTVAASATRDVLVKVRSFADLSKLDVVKATTTKG
jgi:hypothetical protein